MARNFTTSTDKVSIVDNAALQITGSISIYMWVYLNAGSVYHSLISKCIGNGGGTNENPYDLRTSNAASPTLNFIRNAPGIPTSSTRTSTFTLSAGAWTHIAIADKGDSTANNLKMYKNRDTVNTLTASITGEDIGQPVLIGERDDALGGNCRIAWVGLHNVVLTQEEIGEAMYRGFTMRGLVGCWPLFGDATEADLSGNKFNGTVTGTAIVEGPPITPPWYRSIHEDLYAFKNENFGYPGENLLLGWQPYHHFVKTPKNTGTDARQVFNLNDLRPEGS